MDRSHSQLTPTLKGRELYKGVIRWGLSSSVSTQKGLREKRGKELEEEQIEPSVCFAVIGNKGMVW